MRSSLDEALADSDVVVVAKRSPEFENWLLERRQRKTRHRSGRALPQRHASERAAL